MEMQEPGRPLVVDQSPGAKASAHEARRPDAPLLSAPRVQTDRPAHPWRLWIILGLGLIVLAVIALFGGPMLVTALNTVSTDDAYVNGHVTFVAPRVAGQVMEVFVDDNYRVTKGDLLVQLDKEPYQVQLAIKQSAVTAADLDLEAAKSK